MEEITREVLAKAAEGLGLLSVEVPVPEPEEEVPLLEDGSLTLDLQEEPEEA
jgi:hypothetical protein